jgi:ribosome-associated toxin RatA of RatAB toxin-antitoxin module
MRDVKRSALVPFTAEQMFALVEDIESYPQFVPWVTTARLIERTESEVIGTLEMHRAGVREAFTTRNSLRRPREIVLTLVEGPFRELMGRWTFDAVVARARAVYG